jgi:hypothetical protein
MDEASLIQPQHDLCFFSSHANKTMQICSYYIAFTLIGFEVELLIYRSLALGSFRIYE